MQCDRRICNAWIVWALEAIMLLIYSVTGMVTDIKTPRLEIQDCFFSVRDQSLMQFNYAFILKPVALHHANK